MITTQYLKLIYTINAKFRRPKVTATFPRSRNTVGLACLKMHEPKELQPRAPEGLKGSPLQAGNTF